MHERPARNVRAGPDREPRCCRYVVSRMGMDDSEGVALAGRASGQWRPRRHQRMQLTSSTARDGANARRYTVMLVVWQRILCLLTHIVNRVVIRRSHARGV